MASLRMQIQAANDPFGAYTDVDIAGLFMRDFRLVVSYSHPASLTWTMTAGEHEIPIEVGAFIRFWDADGTTPDAASQSATNPLFEGHVQYPIPSKSNELTYTAYDPMYRAQTECHIMSTAWQEGEVATTTFPVEGTGAYPRLVVCADNLHSDPDYALSRTDRVPAGDIISVILDDQYHPLYWIHAAPGDGTDAGNGVAYVSADGTTMDTEPQEKMVFESENPYSAIMRLLAQYEPDHKLLWRPGTRKWRFIRITESDQVTLTFNRTSGSNLVLACDINPSMEGRYTAVSFYGPELTPIATVSTQDGSLTPLESGKILLETVGSTAIYGYTQWQVADSTKRRMARLLPASIQVPTGEYFWYETKYTTLQASWDNGRTWISIGGAYFDFRNGIASTGSTTPYFFTSAGVLTATGIKHFLTPTHVRMIYSYFAPPIFTRYPETGFSGTAYSIGNRANEWKINDEMMAVGRSWFGTPYTTSQRLAKFNTLAEKIHRAHKDIVYAGGATLAGIEYEWAWLDKRVNFTSRNADGGTLTTGLEDVNAWVTDVEFNFEDDITTLTFNSDQLQLIGEDVEMMKRRLRIKALAERSTWNLIATPVYGATSLTWGGAMLPIGYVTTVTQNTVWVDPNTGVVEETF